MITDLSTALSRARLRYGRGGPDLARRLDRRLAEHPRRRTVRTAAGRMEVDTADLVDRYLYLFGVWEPHLSRWLPMRVGPGDVVVDVGSFTGWFSLLAARAGADVVAVEPSPDAVAVLRRHLRAQPAGRRVRVVHAAVGAGEGRATFAAPSPGNRGATTAVTDGRAVRDLADAADPFTAPVLPLAAVLTGDELARTRLVKIDVEGDEAGVVDGLVPLLDRVRPDVEIAVEVAPDRLAARGRTAADVVAPLRAAGFATYRIPNDYRAESYPATLRATDPRPPYRFDEPITVQHDLVFSRSTSPTLSTPAELGD